MFKRAGVCGLAMAVVAAAVVGCGQKGGGRPTGPQPADSFGLADANVVVRGNPAGVLSSKFYVDITKAIASMPMLGGDGKSIDDTLKETLGLDPADVKCVVAHANVEGEKFVITVVLKKPIDRDAVIAALAKQGPKLEKQETHGGVDLLAPSADEKEVMAFPKPDLVVMGTKDEVKKGIDRMKAGKAVQLGGKAADALAAAPKGAGLVVVAVPTPELAQMATAAAATQAPEAAGMVENVVSVTVAVTSGDALDLNVVVELKTEKDADEMRQQAATWLATGKLMAGPMLMGMNLTQLGEPVMKMLEDVKISGKGKCADIKASVPAGLVTTAAEAMKAMSGGAGGGM